MQRIVNNSKTASDISIKKSKFKALLSSHKIELDETNYFETKANNKFCLGGNVHDYLSYINILRQNKNNRTIQDIEYLLITGKTELLEKDSMNSLIGENSFSLTKSLNYITKILWFVMNKGFGTKLKLTSFDTLHRSKMVLSGLLATKIKTIYEELKLKLTNGEITKEQLPQIIYDLRQQAKTPEEIDAEQIPSILSQLTEDDIEQYKNNLSKKDQEIEQKEQELSEKKLELEEMRQKQKKDQEELKRLKYIEAKVEKKKMLKNIILNIILSSIIICIIIFVFNKFIFHVSKTLGWIDVLFSLMLSLIGFVAKCILKKFKKDIKQFKGKKN